MMCGGTFPDTTTFCPKDGSALRAAVPVDDLIGEVFCDRYVVTDLLGEGGMGAVYAARDVRLPQQVAIKVLRERGMADPSVIARFRQEAEAASRINHDRVARVTDFGFMNDGRAYLVMEYVGGRTLKQMVTDLGPLEASVVSRIVTMVAEGLDAAHRLGIVHRDLKPDNIMVLDDAGGGVRVKVLDFGIAKVLQGGEESAGQTKTGFVIGTPLWMSPEQILGETLDGRSDVYSLALVAFYMLTGHRAFESTTAEAEMMTRLASPPRQLTEVLPGTSWPDGLQELLNRTLARDADERPDGALAFARAFAHLIDANHTVASVSAPDGASLRTSAADMATSSQTRAPAGSLSAATSSGAPLGRGATTPASTASTPPAGSVVSPNGAGKRIKAVPAVLALAAVAVVTFFAIWQFGGGNAPANVDAGAVTALSSESAARDSVNRRAGSTPNAETPAVVAEIAQPPASPDSPRNPGTARNAAGSATTPGSATPARRNDIGTSVPGRDAPPAPRAPAPRTTAEVPTAAQSAAAHSELLSLMDIADVELNGKDSVAVHSRAREIIRKLEAIVSKLAGPTDQGNAHLYMAMSYATLGDQAKACGALARAESLTTESRALRSNVEQWSQVLKCGR